MCRQVSQVLNILLLALVVGVVVEVEMVVVGVEPVAIVLHHHIQ
jgi:hypothetical protein